MGNIVKLTDIGENETLIDYAVRKEAECNELRDRIAILRETIGQACIMEDSEQITEILSGALVSV
ncbi:hypothetical protein BOO91_14490 [Vibrio navarrensis]|uniref:Uncharacterized protein n=1 Tax=Vibrio navarrensis TaxID=29495 RepID=A0AAJ4LT40_9VIBR|nr:hypothetical protein [Vibrio navarrensis]MBE3662138.1 hypothetical protein [Vibrio navarrensis]QPL52446.1 hypothetical protein I3X05_10490 [Vibrio navarrensis]